jgi:hypothetical protein
MERKAQPSIFGSEVGATDADVDDATDRQAGETKHLPGANTRRQRRPFAGAWQHLRHDIEMFAGEGASRSPQGHMQHRAIFAGIDPLAAEHPGRPLVKPGLAGELDQQVKRRRVHALLREVEKDAFEA